MLVATSPKSPESYRNAAGGESLCYTKAVLRILWTTILLLSLMLSGCRRARIQTPGLTSDPPDAGVVVDAGPKPKKKRRRLPPPLRPEGSRREHTEEVTRPCTILVNHVCALLSEGAEECTEARTRIHRRPGTVKDQRCTQALEWYRKHIEDAPKRRRIRPCKLLAVAKCAVYGKDSAGCAHAKSDIAHLAKTLDHACRADLLLFKGFR